MVKKGKLAQRWFFSVIAVVSIVLAIFMLLCIYLIYSLRISALHMSSELAEHTRYSMDGRLDEIRKNTVLFELSNTNTKLKHLSVPPKGITSDIYQLCDQLHNLNTSSALVDNIYIYYPKINYIAGELGFHDQETYYTLLRHKNQNTSMGIWRPEDNLPENSQFAHTTIGNKSYFYYVKEMRYNNELVGLLVIEINEAEFLQSAQSIGSQVSVVGVVLNKQLILASGNDENIAALYLSFQQNNDGDCFRDKNNMALYVYASDFLGLEYVAGYPHNALYKPVYVAIIICASGLFLSLFLTVLSSLKISSRNVRPLVNLLAKFPGNAAESQDEYQYISGKIDQLLIDKFENSEKLVEQQALIGNLFLNTVLQGDLHDEYAVFSAAKQYEILLENPIYQVAVLRFKKEIDEEIVTDATNYFEELRIEVLAAKRGTKLVLLFNAETSQEEHQNGQMLFCMLKNLFPKKIVVAAFGNSYDSLVNIHTSYLEALAALPALANTMTYAINHYSKRLRSSDAQRRQGIALMEEFTRQLYAARYTQASQLVPNLINKYIVANGLAVNVQERTVMLKNLLLDELEKSENMQHALPQKLSYKNLRAIDSAVELEQFTLELLSVLARKDTPTSSEEGSIPARAKAIIQQNFTDPMLGLYMVSDRLKVSNTYLSTCFKAEFGIGATQYINELRIDQAKNIILNTNLNIKEIALAVGFTSDISFIRVFKKYEEKTPSALRKVGEDVKK